MTRVERFSRRSRGWVALAVALSLCGATEVAAAQGKGKGKGKPAAAVKVDVEALRARLGGADAASIVAALDETKKLGPAGVAAAPAVEALLVRGTTVPVAKAAIDALGALGASTSSAVLRPYVRHRAPELRRAAVRALAATKGPDAVRSFRDGLHAEDGLVRGFSATGLGNLGATEALPDLFKALDRGVVEAAAAVGQLCGPADCNRLLGYLGKLSWDVMTSGLDPMLFRVKPLPEEQLLAIVGRLRDLGTPEAGKYLADVRTRWTGSARVKQALADAVASIPGAS